MRPLGDRVASRPTIDASLGVGMVGGVKATFIALLALCLVGCGKKKVKQTDFAASVPDHQALPLFEMLPPIGPVGLVLMGVVADLNGFSLGKKKENQPVREPAKEELSFERDIHGLFGKYCFDCHGAEKTEAGLDLRGLEVMLKGGEGGPAIVPGKPAESLLLELMESGEMPPDGARPKAEDIELVRRWIAEGARQ